MGAQLEQLLGGTQAAQEKLKSFKKQRELEEVKKIAAEAAAIEELKKKLAFQELVAKCKETTDAQSSNDIPF